VNLHTLATLSAALVLRAAVATIFLSVLLALLQILRLGPVVVELGLSASNLLWAGLLLVPAILTVALPAGLLIAALTTFREQSRRQQWLVWRASGVRLKTVATLLAGLGLGATVLSGFSGAFVGPLALEALADNLQQGAALSRLRANPHEPLLIRDDLALAAGEAHWVEGDGPVGTEHFEDLWFLRRTRHETLLVVAERAELQSGSLVFSEARVSGQRELSDGSTQKILGTHREVVIDLNNDEPMGYGGDWLRYLPVTERRTVFQLFDDAATANDEVAARRARTALSKRAALMLAPLLLLFVAFPLSSPTSVTQIGTGFHVSALVMVGLSALFFALLRAGEIMAHDGGPTWLAVVLPCSVLSLGGAWLWMRLKRVW